VLKGYDHSSLGRLLRLIYHHRHLVAVLAIFWVAAGAPAVGIRRNLKRGRASMASGKLRPAQEDCQEPLRMVRLLQEWLQGSKVSRAYAMTCSEMTVEMLHERACGLCHLAFFKVRG